MIWLQNFNKKHKKCLVEVESSWKGRRQDTSGYGWYIYLKKK